MLTRRSILVGAIATAAIMRPRTGRAKPSQPATPVNFDVPAGACDCHTHIHGDPEKFPFFAGRTYTPEMALPEEMAAFHKALHMQRGRWNGLHGGRTILPLPDLLEGACGEQYVLRARTHALAHYAR